MTVREDATIRNSWSDGFVADVFVGNDTNTTGPVTAIIEIDGSIKKHWGGSFEALGEGRYQITFEGVEPGETVSAGFVADADPDAGVGLEIVGGDTAGDTASTPEETPETDTIAAPEYDAPETTAPEETARTVPDLGTAGADVTVSDDISAAELQELIDDSAPGTTIAMEAGTYSFDRTIDILRDDISLVGAGSDDVTIRMARGLGEEAFHIGHASRSGDYELSRSADQGDTIITLDSASHSFQAGDFVYLERETTSSFLDSIGDTAWREDAPLRASIVEVASVDGAELTLESGLHFDFVPSETTVEEIDMVTGVTLGGFSVDYAMGSADPSDFSNTASDYNRNAVIEVEGTAGLTLSDITGHDVPSLGTNVALSRDVRADGLTMTGAHNKGAGGNGYALQIRDVYDSSFTGLNDLDMRHSVVFASWRSAVNNEVHVESTDRDINFHGGRDHGNTVRVDSSVRDALSDVIAPSVFFNTMGTHYGAPTEEGANTVTIRYAVGSSRRDDITGDDGGAWLDGAGSHDILRGGAGDDVLIGGHGRDTLIGGAGEDVALYTGDLEDFRIDSIGGGRLRVDDRVGDQHRDEVEGVEWLVFDNAAYRVSDGAVMARDVVGTLTPEAVVGASDAPEPEQDPVTKPEIVEDDATATPEAPEAETPTDSTDEAPEAPAGTSGDPAEQEEAEDTGSGDLGTSGGDDEWIAITSSEDFVMRPEHDKVELVGQGELRVTGSSTADLILGNRSDNIIAGQAGNDRVWARNGDDRVFGGSGNDELHAGGGDDTVHGGGGVDLLFGDGGDDVFRFDTVNQSDAATPDTIADFGGDDVIDLRQIDANVHLSGNQAFEWSGSGSDGAGSLWVSGDSVLGDVDGDGAADLVILVPGADISDDSFFF
ncbi:calcium-binding protein [Roseivivax marinus]|uniref:calcium-binding protein n=1 Tax=Roseivivax marinus TaxID=1379903 RepID=UPI00273E7F0E|nr:calcium-binding protein [Roseivivax marinus]